MTRKEARIFCFEVIFQMVVNDRFTLDIKEKHQSSTEKKFGKQSEYISSVIDYALKNHRELTESIMKSRNLGKDDKAFTMSYTDTAIIMLALCEKHSDADIPDKVIMNEAIEIAKAYSHDNAHKFINAVLRELFAM